MTYINTNVSATIANNSLTRNERAMNTAMERLSTGLRINSAKDDAAGLAITSKMTAQIKGLNQAVRNANDAVSMIQTAEGALVEVSNMMQRMREIAVQSASDTNTSDDRGALDLEFQSLKTEINRIGANTQWNGMGLLDKSADGNTGAFKYQVGANASQTIDLSIGDYRMTTTSGATAVAATGTANVPGPVTESSVVTFVGLAAGETVTIADRILTATVAMDATAVATAFGAGTVDAAVGTFTGTLTGFTAAAASGATVKFTSTVAGSNVTDLVITDTIAAGPKPTQVITQGLTSTAVAQISTLTIGGTAALGDVISVTVGNKSTDHTVVAGAGAVQTADEIAAAILTKLGAITGASGANANGVITFTAAAAGTGFEISTSTAGPDGLITNIKASAITTQANSNTSISALDIAIKAVNTGRAQMGATINRLEYAADNLTSISANTTESRGRILDADYAKETTELARAQIIAQAGTAMLAQANQVKQTVLSLLK